MAFATRALASCDAPDSNRRAPTPPTPCLRKGLSLTNTAADRNRAETHVSQPSPRPAARINGVVPVASPTLAAGRSPRETYRGFVRAVFSRDNGGDRDPPIVPIVLGEDAERRFREKQPEKEFSPGDGSLASAAARAAVAGSAVSAKPPGGASPSASSASHTHRASRASFSAAECSSVPPSPSGDRGQAASS